MSMRVVTKGNYTHRQLSRFLEVKQYLITEENGKRYLYLRFFNGGSETVTSFRMNVLRYTGEGKPIGSGEYGYDGPPVLTGEEFGPFEKIPVETDCEDVRVEIVSVRSHDYVYEPKKNTVTVRYLPEAERGDFSALARKTGGKKCVVLSKTKRITAILMAAAFLLAAAIGGFSVLRFAGKRTEDTQSEERYERA